ERGAAKGAAHGAAGLLVPRGLMRRGVAGARGGIATAEDIAIGLRLLHLLLGGRRGSLLGSTLIARRRTTLITRRGTIVVVIVRCAACAIGQIGGRCAGRLRQSGSAQQGDRHGGDKRCAEHWERLQVFCPSGKSHIGDAQACSMSKQTYR